MKIIFNIIVINVRFYWQVKDILYKKYVILLMNLELSNNQEILLIYQLFHKNHQNQIDLCYQIVEPITILFIILLIVVNK